MKPFSEPTGRGRLIEVLWWLCDLPAAILGDMAAQFVVGAVVRIASYAECGVLDLVSSAASREDGRGNQLPSGQRAGPRLTDGGGPVLLDRNCKHLDIDRFAYLRDILRRLPAHPADQLDELLPDVWFASHPSARRRPPLERVPRGTRGSARNPSGASAPFYADFRGPEIS